MMSGVFQGQGPQPSRPLITGHIDHLNVDPDKTFFEEGFFAFETDDGVATHCLLPKERKNMVERKITINGPLINQNQMQNGPGAPENRSTSLNYLGDNVIFNTSRYTFKANEIGVLVHPHMLLAPYAFANDAEFKARRAWVEDLYVSGDSDCKIIKKSKQGDNLYPYLTLPQSEVDSGFCFAYESYQIRDQIEAKIASSGFTRPDFTSIVNPTTSSSIPFTTAATRALALLHPVAKSTGASSFSVGNEAELYFAGRATNPGEKIRYSQSVATFLTAYGAYMENFRKFRWSQDAEPMHKKGIKFALV